MSPAPATRWLLALSVLVSVLTAASPSEASAKEGEPAPGKTKGRTELVGVGSDGKLHYSPYTSRGDALPDFSHCGYAGGDRAIPDAPVRETLSPQPDGSDD